MIVKKLQNKKVTNERGKEMKEYGVMIKRKKLEPKKDASEPLIISQAESVKGITGRHHLHVLGRKRVYKVSLVHPGATFTIVRLLN